MNLKSSFVAGIGISLVAAACGGTAAPSPQAKDAPGFASSVQKSSETNARAESEEVSLKCPSIKDADRPWNMGKELSEKLLTGGTGGRGVVLVKYDGCRIEVLGDCEAQGAYSFRPSQRTTIEEILYNIEELYAQLPFDAPRLKAEFQKGGIWSLQAALVGDYETPTESIGLDQISKKCAQATHFLKSFSVGAYRLEVIKEQNRQTKKELLLKGGAFERCFLSSADADSPDCGNVVRMHLKPVELKSSLPPSDKHHLLDQLPGSERVRRIESKHRGEMIEVPASGKTTAVIFWSATCEPCPEEEEGDEEASNEKKNKKKKKKKSKEEQACESCEEDPVYDLSKKMMGVLEGIWRKMDGKRAQVIGVSADMDEFKARNRLGDLQVTFPVVSDGETDKLKNRFQAADGFPAVFLVDEKGYLRYYSDCSEGDSENIDKAMKALAGY